MAAIQCFVPDCNNDAVGQCKGLRVPCGHAFCAKHSRGGLCDECAALQGHGILLVDYLGASAKLGTPWLYSGLFVVFLLSFAFTSKYLAGLFPSWAVYIAFTAALLLIACGGGWLIYKMKYKKACKTRRRFDEFHRANRTRNAVILDIISDVAAETVVMAPGDMPSGDESARRDIDRIRNSLRLYRERPPAS
jgi:hypothetical protein